MKKYWTSLVSLSVLFLLLFVSVYTVGDRVIFTSRANPSSTESQLALLEKIARDRQTTEGNIQVKRDEKLGFELRYDSDLWQEDQLSGSDPSFSLITRPGQGEGSLKVEVVLPSDQPRGKVRERTKVTIGENSADRYLIEESYFGQTSVYEEYYLLGSGRGLKITLRYVESGGVRAELEKVLQTLVLVHNSGWQVQGAVDGKTDLTVEEVVELVRPSVVGILQWSCQKAVVRTREYRFCGSSKGSGFIVSSDGVVVTNAHVAAPTAPQLLVERLPDSSSGKFLDDLTGPQRGGKNVQEEIKSNPTAFNSLVKHVFSLIEKGDLKLEIEDQSVLVRTGNQPFSLANESTGRLEESQKANPAIFPATLILAEASNRFTSEVVLHARSQKGRDIAVLRIDRAGREIVFPELNLSSGQDREGAKIIIIGFPIVVEGGKNPDSALLYQVSSVRPTVTTGIISAIKSDGQGYPLIQTDASIEQGNSGGPAVNDRGEVVGIVIFGVDSKLGNFNFLRPATGIDQVLKQANISQSHGETGSEWKQGLADFKGSYFGQSVVHFNRVKLLDPAHPTVDVYLSEAGGAISAGKDQGRLWGIDKKLVFAGSVSFALTGAVGGLIEFLRRKRQGSLPSDAPK